MTTARLFINTLIDFALEWDVPLYDSLINRTDDINAALYATLMRKKCIVCGVIGELHHVDSVGLGRNRNEITHIGMRAMCLCRKCHDECHMVGQNEFDARNHIYGIAIDEIIAEKWNLLGGYKDERIVG